MCKLSYLGRELITILLLIISINLFSQKIIENPRVEHDSSDEASEVKITSIVIAQEYTFIAFTYATALFKPSIIVNSKSYLKTNLSGSEYKILEWGMISNDEDDPFVSLQFNEQYFTKRRILYNFYLVFPPIPDKTASIDIILPALQIKGSPEGIYWRGVYINEGERKDYFRDKPDYQESERFVPVSSGSGFAISYDGYIATCQHVIADAKHIKVKGVNGNFETLIDARVVATDEDNDLAILKIDSPSLSQIPYTFANQPSDVGESIFVLGYPETQHLGEELKLTTGVISSSSGYRGDITKYQVSAQALPGNSGCPLFDNDGRIIGVINAKYIEPNVSYAVKADYLKSLIRDNQIKLRDPPKNEISGKSLAEKVKSVRNFIYIIEIGE
ncbi:MAG: serine protease [Bacteroidales bacterium]